MRLDASFKPEPELRIEPGTLELWGDNTTHFTTVPHVRKYEYIEWGDDFFVVQLLSDFNSRYLVSLDVLQRVRRFSRKVKLQYIFAKFYGNIAC